MLALAFFISVFSTLIWLIFAVAYVNDHLNGVAFSSLGITDISIYVGLALLPILILWMVFGFINQYLGSRALSNNMFSLFKQMKKNQDYTDLIARIMLEAEQEIKDGFILSKFDLFIADMNELIADLLTRCNIASTDQIDRLWSKVQNGGKWAFGKVLIEVNQNQPNFQMRIYEKSQRDNVIAGTILEWCARYLSLTSLLEKHDKERVFITIIETGVFGKVFSILAPVSDEIRRSREFAPSGPAAPVFAQKENLSSAMPQQTQVVAEEEEVNQISAQDNTVAQKTEKAAFFEKIDAKAFAEKAAKLNPFRKEKKQPFFAEPSISNAEEKDPFSMALERSFGETEELAAPKIEEPSFDKEDDFSVAEEMSAPVNEPRFEPQVNDMPEIDVPAPKVEPKEAIVQPEDDSFANTRKTLNDLKKEWEEMRNTTSSATTPQEPEPSSLEKAKPEPKEEEKEENYAYPFGSWTNEANYHK